MPVSDLPAIEPGTLYVVATPIGNLEDISPRALRVLGEVELVAAEDTRHTRKLFNHFGITTRLLSLHEHNEAQRAEQLIEKLQGGMSLGLVSDAGTPCISDPGYRLVAACRDAGLKVASVPGPTAFTTALSIAGLPSDRFTFCGFMPAKKSARLRELEAFTGRRETLIFYESPHRLVAALEDMYEVFGADCQTAVARELTKLHEEVVRGTLAEVQAEFSGRDKVRGEIVILLVPSVLEPELEDLDSVLRKRLAEDERPARQVVKEVAREFGLSGSEVYQRYLELKADA
ncbi:MAG: 16S rRNA (cytidine(1402)-2'-O)-methyltransferase [Desulfuromonas sp.]|nr:MAG: 16S rRNA (cytidine(1402)-2'-O)-methyltransferase [Desulfuromonas sp.]